MHTRERAFTLIELLVVVAIIVVLIAILLPSLGRAREQAKLTACQSNFSQVGKVLMMYASSNGDMLPYCKSSGSNTTNWMVLILQELQSNSTGGTFATTSIRLKERQMFQCPSALVLAPGDASVSGHPRLMPDISATDKYTGKPYRTIKQFKVNNPSQTAILFDARLWISPTSANARSIASDMDAYRLTTGYDTYLLAAEVRTNGSTTSPESPISYDPPAGDNLDMPSTASGGAFIRFRHMNDTWINVLMVDGHAESFVTGPAKNSNNLMRKYININAE